MPKIRNVTHFTPSGAVNIHTDDGKVIPFNSPEEAQRYIDTYFPAVSGFYLEPYTVSDDEVVYADPTQAIPGREKDLTTNKSVTTGNVWSETPDNFYFKGKQYFGPIDGSPVNLTVYQDPSINAALIARQNNDRFGLRETPFNWGFTLNNIVDNINSSWNRVKKDFTEEDPIFGNRRRVLVDRYYNSDNPFRQGNDQVARWVTNLAALYGVGKALPALYGSLSAATPGELAAGLIGSAAGGYAGGKLFDWATNATSGKNWGQFVDETGAPSWMAYTQPGSMVGGVVGGNVATGIYNNAYPWFANQTAMNTPNGTVAPGQSVTLNLKPAPYAQGGGPAGQFNYRASYTTGNGSTAGQPAYSRVRLGTRPSINTGEQYRVVGSNVPLKAGQGAESSVTYSNPYLPFNDTWGIPMPWLYPTPIEYPVVPPVIPPVVEPDYRYEFIVDPHEAFGRWWQQQDSGTVQYYEGDPYHKSGLYKIGFDPNYSTKYIRGVANNNGYVVPDSQTIITPAPTGINELEGGVNPAAVTSPVNIFVDPQEQWIR